MKIQNFNWRKLSLAAAAFTLALPAMAQSCDPISCTDKIAQLYVSGQSQSGFPNKTPVFVNIAHPTLTHNLGCTSPVGTTYLTLQPDNPGYDQIFSLLQAYTLAGKPVKFRMFAPSNNCRIAYVVVTP
jgi:hypothetical protein